MTNSGDPSTGTALFGALLAVVGFLGFEYILWQSFGSLIAALPVSVIFMVLGYRLCWVPADGSAGPLGGNAGASGSGTGMPYVVQIDPEDPGAGIPRRGA